MGYKTFACSYRFAGSEWLFTIKAKDVPEASERLTAIRCNATVDGEQIAIVPAGGGWLVKAVVWARNFFTNPSGG